MPLYTINPFTKNQNESSDIPVKCHTISLPFSFSLQVSVTYQNIAKRVNMEIVMYPTIDPVHTCRGVCVEEYGPPETK
jgi:hypothetical protein